MGAIVGALIGLAIGLGLSYYVWRLDMKKREAGLRSRPNYHLSLLAVPIILAIVGAAIGGAIAG